MKARRYSRKNRAPSRLRLIANRDHVSKQRSGFENVEDRLSFVMGNVDPYFTKCFHRQRVQFARFESSTLGLEGLAALLVDQRRGHLAARTVMNADEQHLLFHGQI